MKEFFFFFKTKGQKVRRLYYSKAFLAVNPSHLSLPHKGRFQSLVVYQPRPVRVLAYRYMSPNLSGCELKRGIRALDATHGVLPEHCGCARVRNSTDEQEQHSHASRAHAPQPLPLLRHGDQ